MNILNMAPLKNYKLGLREKFLLNISKLEYSPFKLYLSNEKCFPYKT